MNRNYFALMAAASLVVGGLTTNLPAQEMGVLGDDNVNRGVGIERQAVGAGTVRADASEVYSVAATFAEAMVKGSYEDLVERFTEEGNDRFERVEDLVDLGAAQAAFREAWEARYGEEFELEDKEAQVFAAARLLPGDAGALLASQKMGVDTRPPAGPTDGLNDSQNVDRVTPLTDHDEDVIVDLQDDRDPGTRLDDRMVTLAMPGAGGEQLVLTLQNEGWVGDDWRIVPPAGIDGATLANRVQNTLVGLTAQADQWPANRALAYQLVSRQLLSVLALQPDRPLAQQAGYQERPDVRAQQPDVILVVPADQQDRQLRTNDYIEPGQMNIQMDRQQQQQQQQIQQRPALDRQPANQGSLNNQAGSDLAAEPSETMTPSR